MSPASQAFYPARHQDPHIHYDMEYLSSNAVPCIFGTVRSTEQSLRIVRDVQPVRLGPRQSHLFSTISVRANLHTAARTIQDYDHTHSHLPTVQCGESMTRCS
ncbi:hypothetical protein M3J09_008996 [Ascochyta lentis]